MPKISDEKKSLRKRQILNAAFQCFIEKGYEQTTMREIFDKAGLSAGAVYIYFRSKEEIIQSLAKAGKYHFEQISNEFDDDKDQFMKVLEKLAFLIDKKGGDVGIKLEVSLLAASLNDSDLKNILKDKLQHDITLVENLLKKSKFKTSKNIPELARVITAAIQGLSIQKMLNSKLSLKNILDGLNI